MVITDISQCVNSSCLEQGLHMKLGYYLLYPYMLASGPNEFWGVMPDNLLPYIFGSSGITYEFHRSRTLQYTERLPNGTWTSDFGILQRREVDMNVGGQYNYIDRFETFRATTAYQNYEIHIVAGKGKVEVYDFFSFLHKIEGIVGNVLMMSFVVLVTTSALCEATKKGNLKVTEIGKNAYVALWMFLAALFCEGSPRTLSTRRGQTLQFIWLFSVLVFMNGLCGQFKAILLVQQDDDVIHTVQDLADRPHLAPMMVENTIFQKVLRDSPMENFQIIYRNVMSRRNETMLTLQQFVSPATYQRVKDGKGVVFSTEQMTKSILAMICQQLSGTRKIYFVDETFYPFQMVLFFNRDVPPFLENLVNHRIYRTVECGLFDRWYAEFYKNYDECVQDPPPPEISLRLQHLLQAFYLLVACLVACGIIFFCELFYYLWSHGCSCKKTNL